MSFSSAPVVRFDLQASFDKAAVKSMILSAAYQNRGTATGAALDLARTAVLTSAAGYRGGQAVVVVITDGATQESAGVLSAAVAAMQAVAEVFVVGVGSEVNVDELHVIASAPTSMHVTVVAGVSDLGSVTSAVSMQVMCNAPPTILSATPSSIFLFSISSLAFFFRLALASLSFCSSSACLFSCSAFISRILSISCIALTLVRDFDPL